MADVNANIGVNVDTSNALAQIKSLQRQLSQFYTSIAKSSETAAVAQRNLQRNLINSINSLGTFSAEMRTIKTSAESFTESLEKNRFSMREYFRYAGASTKTFGKLFRSEFDTITKVAEENVKRLQTQYIKLGRDSNGAMKAIAVIPTELNMQDFATKTQMAAQKQALFNQLVKQGSTNLLNFGKNTQWAGRQLMVGFTIPLTILGSTASRTFMEMEAAALKFRKVYGDLFTPREETAQALADVEALGQMFTRYGIAVSQTVNLAAEAAAAGFQGLDLQRQVTEATRLQVLGQVDQQKALETTIALQNAFQMSSEDLSGAINFLNAVENQTVVSLDDITTAIPKAAPVVRQLGGDVKDLAFFMAAMKEGGINASEGANALKSGLASLINPTDKASEMLAGFGINIRQIVQKNAGNVKQTVIDFALALDNLSDLNRQRAIEQLFGKFQLARLSTLFENVTKTGNQASRVLDLATASTADLASMAEQELGMTAESSMNKFRKAVEDLKFSLVPVGQTFLEAVTPIVEFLGNILDKFNNLSSGAKKAITILTVAVGAIGPVALMTFGLLANGLANIIKFVQILRNGYLRLTGQSQVLGEQTQYLTMEQQNAAAVAHSLDQSHAKLTQTFNLEAGALQNLTRAYQSALTAAQNFAMQNPGAMMPPRRGKKYAKGVVSVPGPKGAGDVVPAMLSPGESVIPADMTQKYGPLIQGMVAGNIPGFQQGLFPAYTNAVTLLSSQANQALKGSKGFSASALAQEFSAGGAGIQAPIIRAIAESLGATNVNQIVSMIQGDPNLAKFGENISMGVAEQLAKVSGNVTDPQLSQIYQEVARNQAKNFGQVYQDATEKFLTDITTFEDVTQQRVSQSTGRTRSIGRASLFQNKRSYRSMGFGKIAGALGMSDIKGKVLAHMTGRQMVDIGAMGGNLTPAASAAIARMGGQATNVAASAVASAQKSKSPSKVAQQLGFDFGEGYADGIAKATAEVSGAASGLTTAATTGVKKPGLKSRLAGMGRGLAGGRGGMIASTALMGASFLPGKAGQVAGQAASVAFGLQAVGMALRILPGPLKLFGVGLAAGYGIMKLVNAARERERQAIEGLGDAATLTAQKAKTLGDFFGMVPSTTPLERSGPSLVVNQQTRTQLDALRGSESFQKDFGKDIGALKNATDKQAELIFNALAIQLKGKGFAKEQIDLILKALQEESGKVNLKLEFKDMDLTTKEGQQKLKSNLATLGKSLGKEFSKGYTGETKTAVSGATGEVVTWTEETLSRGLKKSLATTSKIISGMLNGISGQLENGTITVEQFNTSFQAISKTITDMPKPQAALLLGEVFKNLPGELAKSALGLKNTSDQLMLVEAAMIGVASITPAMIAALKMAETSLDGGAQRAASRVRAKIREEIKNLKELRAIVAKELGGGTGGGGGDGDGEESAYDKAMKQLKERKAELLNTKNAFAKLTKAGMEAGRAFEIAKDPILAAALASTKVGTKEWDALYKILNKVKDLTNDEDLKNFLVGRQTELQLKKDFAAIMPMLAKLNLSAKDIEAILGNPDLMQKFVDDLADGKVDSQQIKEYLDSLPQEKAIDILLKLQTPGGFFEVFEQGYQEAMDYFEGIEIAKRQAMESTAEWKAAESEISAAEAAIKAAESKIQTEQDIIDAAQYDLDTNPIYGQQVINGINKKIDAEQNIIDSINEEIARREEEIALLERQIDLEYDRPIAALQDESDKLSNTLDLISRQEDAINAKYDKQEEALSRIAKINQQISNQKKQQISLADALTQGDISAAAQIAQDMQASNAEAAIEAQQNALGAARQAELGGVAVNGMTRAQIEERQFQISQQIFNLEQQRKNIQVQIQAIEDDIYKKKLAIVPHEKAIRDFEQQIKDIELLRQPVIDKIEKAEQQIAKIRFEDLEPAKKRLADAEKIKQDMEAQLKAEMEKVTYLEQNKLAWENTAKSVEAAKKSGEGLQAATEAASGYVQAIVDKWNSLEAEKNLTINISEFVTRYITEIVNRVYTDSGSSGGGGGGGGDQVVMAMGGQVPRRKYFAVGGMARGSDTVPAMLTPGEFIVNRAATARFKPLLEKMNQAGYPSLTKPSYSVSNAPSRGTTPSISSAVISNPTVTNAPVYNYSLNVNVSGTDVDEYTIANTVMSKIQQMQDRQIKRQVV